MGGLAIKQVIGKEGERFDKPTRDLYLSIIREVCPEIYSPAEVQEKESYGDIDVLVPIDYFNTWKWEILENRIRDCFKKHNIEYQGYHKNSNVYSCAIDNKQVDFVYITAHTIYCANHYYSNNDLGNLIGRIAHGMGLKYGNEGLQVIVRDLKDHILGEITITDTIVDVLEFLGFSDEDIDLYLKRYETGFKTFEELYEWVTRSIFFDGSKYELEELNAINRIRNVKRKTYMNFIEYLNAHPVIKSKRPAHPPYKPYWVMKAIKDYGKEQEYFSLLFKQREIEYLSHKFNGDMVKELYGLERENLGAFIVNFNKKYSREDKMRMTVTEIIEAMNINYDEIKEQLNV